MAYAFDVTCTVCTYSDGALIGMGGYLAICSTCKRIVNLERIPYMYTAKPCPLCSRSIPRPQLVDLQHLERIPCPQCAQGILVFKEIMHMLIGDELQIPLVGELVHVRLDKQGKLTIPDVWGKRIHLEPTQHQVLISEPFEARVVDLDATTISICFIRHLSWSEL